MWPTLPSASYLVRLYCFRVPKRSQSVRTRLDLCGSRFGLDIFLLTPAGRRCDMSTESLRVVASAEADGEGSDGSSSLSASSGSAAVMPASNTTTATSTTRTPTTTTTGSTATTTAPAITSVPTRSPLLPSSTTSSAALSPCAIVGIAVGCIMGTLAAGAAPALVCTYCGCCRRCGGGCCAPFSDSDGDGSSAPTSASSRHSFGDRKSATATATSSATTFSCCSCSRSETESDTAGSQAPMVHRGRGSWTATTTVESETTTWSEGWDSVCVGDGEGSGVCTAHERSGAHMLAAAVSPMGDVAGCSADAEEELPASDDDDASLREANAPAVLREATESTGWCAEGYDDVGERLPDDPCFASADRGMLTEANAEQLCKADEEARLGAVDSIRLHQGQGSQRMRARCCTCVVTKPQAIPPSALLLKAQTTRHLRER